MERNLTIDELTKVHALGVKAEFVSKYAKENNLTFIYEFSYGIYDAKVFLSLEDKEIEDTIVNDFTLNLFEDGVYERISESLEEALKIASDGNRISRIAYFEEKLSKLKGEVNA